MTQQPPTPQWDARQGRWVLPDQGQSSPYGQQPGYGPPSGGGYREGHENQYAGPQGPPSSDRGYGQGPGQPYGQAPGQGGQAPGQGGTPPPGQGYGQPSGQWPPQPPRAPAKRRKWPWILGAALLLIIIIAVSSGGGTPTPAGSTAAAPSGSAAAPTASAAPPSATSAPAASGVVYEVRGSGRANSISYGANGGISQANGVRLPWTKSAPAEEGFGIYALTAQNNGSGEITCRITVDGEQVAEQTSTGQYAVVSCSGSGSPF